MSAFAVVEDPEGVYHLHVLADGQHHFRVLLEEVSAVEAPTEDKGSLLVKES